MKTLPQGVSSDIVVQALDELLVYFLKTNRAICLNKTAAVVFNACNGVKTLVELRREHKFTDDLIFLALDELRRNDLLENYQSTYFAGLSRREAVKRAGLATMIALPVIAQLVAPRAGEAASRAQLLANGGFCSTGTQCQSSRCGEAGTGPFCCSADDFGACQTSTDCCSGVACSNNVCCQNAGRVCDTRANTCCPGLTCVAPVGTNGTCQQP